MTRKRYIFLLIKQKDYSRHDVKCVHRVRPSVVLWNTRVIGIFFSALNSLPNVTQGQLQKLKSEAIPCKKCPSRHIPFWGRLSRYAKTPSSSRRRGTAREWVMPGVCVCVNWRSGWVVTAWDGGCICLGLGLNMFLIPHTPTHRHSPMNVRVCVCQLSHGDIYEDLIG